MYKRQAVVCALSVALNRRFERVLAPALCGLMVLLYVLAIPRVLSWVDWMAPVLLALTVASAIAALALRKLTPRAIVARFAKNVLTPGTLYRKCLLFMLICLIFLRDSNINNKYLKNVIFVHKLFVIQKSLSRRRYSLQAPALTCG